MDLESVLMLLVLFHTTQSLQKYLPSSINVTRNARHITISYTSFNSQGIYYVFKWYVVVVINFCFHGRFVIHSSFGAIRKPIIVVSSCS